MILCGEAPKPAPRFVADITIHRNPLLMWLMHSHSRVLEHFSVKKRAGLKLSEQEVKLNARSYEACETIASRYAEETAKWWRPELLTAEPFE